MLKHTDLRKLYTIKKGTLSFRGESHTWVAYTMDISRWTIRILPGEFPEEVVKKEGLILDKTKFSHLIQTLVPCDTYAFTSYFNGNNDEYNA